MKKRREPVNSASASVRIMQGTVRQIQPPSHVPLDAQDWPFFESVVAEFARADWSEHQIELAAMLARTMATLEQEQRTLRSEGFVAVRENGTTVENPRARAVKSLAGDILSFRRSLSLNGRSQNGEARDIATRRTQGKALEADVGDMLLAAPEVL